jgi:hypothetical protein
MDKQRHNVEYLKISQIKTFENELKETDNLLLEKMKKSIVKYGQLKNIVVCNKENETYQCIEGSKIVKCMKDLGYSEIAVVNVGNVNENEMQLMRISISRDYFLTNYVLLGEILKELITTHKIEDICNIIPFTIRQTNKMIDMTEFDWEDLNSSKQIEGQKSIFDLLDEDEDDYKVCNEKDKVQEVLIKNEEGIFEEVQLPITEPVKDWKDVVYEESKNDEPQGFFADLEFELADTKEEVKQEFSDLPWEDEEEKTETQQQSNSTLPFTFHEREEYCFLEIHEYKDELIDLCKQLSFQYVKHKFKAEPIEAQVFLSQNTDKCIIEYIQVTNKYDIKMTVRVQNIYQSIVELYEL